MGEKAGPQKALKTKGARTIFFWHAGCYMKKQKKMRPWAEKERTQ